MGLLLIFDMDGTLIDSEQSIVRCFRESAGRLGYNIENASKYIGVLKLTQILSNNGVPDKDLPEIMRLYVQCYLNTFMEDTRPIQNSQTVLEKLQEYHQLGILTLKNLNLTQEIAKQFFPRVKFKYVVCGDRPIENKVEGLKIIIGESGMDPGNIYYIGDRASDVKSADDAGIKSVWVSFGLGKKSDFDFRSHYRTANSYDELLEMFTSRT